VSPSASPDSPSVSTPSMNFTEHLQRFQPSENGRKWLYFYNMSEDESVNDDDFDTCEDMYDTIYWGDNLKIKDYYETCDMANCYPMTEFEEENICELSIAEEYNERVVAKCWNDYYYDDSGCREFLPDRAVPSSKPKLLERKDFPIERFTMSERGIGGKFSDPDVQRKTLEVLKLCGKGVTRVFFNELVSDFNIEILKHLPDLRFVSITYHKSHADFKFIESIKTFCPLVTKIIIDYSAFHEEDEQKRKTQNKVIEYLSSVSNLKVLQLHRFNLVSQKSFELLQTSLLKLKDIFISDSNISNENIQMFLKNCKKLKTIKLDYCPNVTNEFIRSVKNYYPNLIIIKV